VHQAIAARRSSGRWAAGQLRAFQQIQRWYGTTAIFRSQERLACRASRAPLIERPPFVLRNQSRGEKLDHSAHGAGSSELRLASRQDARLLRYGCYCVGGGLGLAAYHAGAYEAFRKRSLRLHWLAGSSAGAVTAALIAGNPDERRIERLSAFFGNFPPQRTIGPGPGGMSLVGPVRLVPVWWAVTAISIHARRRSTHSCSAACTIWRRCESGCKA
jgi:hypothetical protein